MPATAALAADVGGASLSCWENICASCHGEHKHAHTAFGPYFIPPPPLPLIFSLRAVQQSRKSHLKSHKPAEGFLPATDRLAFLGMICHFKLSSGCCI